MCIVQTVEKTEKIVTKVFDLFFIVFWGRVGRLRYFRRSKVGMIRKQISVSCSLHPKWRGPPAAPAVIKYCPRYSKQVSLMVRDLDTK
jgi:hypothetical protein